MVILNGPEEEVKRQREAMEQRRLEAKEAKLAAKVFEVRHLIANLHVFISGEEKEDYLKCCHQPTIN